MNQQKTAKRNRPRFPLGGLVEDGGEKINETER
nr:MAG TPA: hypothetical protein [Caudoviricetes sp.]